MVQITHVFAISSGVVFVIGCIVAATSDKEDRGVGAFVLFCSYILLLAGYLMT